MKRVLLVDLVWSEKEACAVPEKKGGFCPPVAFVSQTNLAAIRVVRSLRIALKGSHEATLLEKLVKISNLSFAHRSFAP